MDTTTPKGVLMVEKVGIKVLMARVLSGTEIDSGILEQ